MSDFLEEFKNAKILFFYTDKCRWCEKMISVLNAENTYSLITPINVSYNEGFTISKKYMALHATPAFASMKYNTHHVGYLDSSQLLLTKLLPKKIKIYVEHYCPICFVDFDKLAHSLACGHLYCSECINNCINKYDNCPICREPMVIYGLVNITEHLDKMTFWDTVKHQLCPS